MINKIKELRAKTGAGMMDCKKAISETKGDVDAAIKWLREKGITKAAKKSGNISAEGSTNVSVKDNLAVILEINAQTDFVAKNDEFKALVKMITDVILKAAPKNIEEAKKIKTKDGTLEDTIVQATAKIGENIVFRRLEVVQKTTKDSFGAYVHGDGKISSLVILEGSKDEKVAKNIAMHAAAMKPEYVNRTEVSKDFIKSETEILQKEAEKSGKPAKVIEGMVKGRLNKQLATICLDDQPFVMEPKQKVSDVAKAVGGKISKLVRFELGDGIEKKVDDFAAEVEAQKTAALKKK